MLYLVNQPRLIDVTLRGGSQVNEWCDMDPRVRNVISLINQDITRELSVSEMARFVNLSPTQFRRMFKAETGLPPAQYFKRVKLQAAKELLEHSYLRVKEIAYRVGFRDESHFVRDFKRAYGLTPAQHRMLNLEPDLPLNAKDGSIVKTANK